jgi:hypothetical protein
MNKLLDVVSVTPQKDQTLLITFENQEKRRFDMKPYLGRMPFSILNNLPLFMKATVAYGTVTWPGNIDIAPETLYDCSEPA